MGKTAWIIGGGSGIGAAGAKELAVRGWDVAISGRRVEKLVEVAQYSELLHPFPLDVTDTEATAKTAAKIAADFGSLDMAMFSAAAWQPMKIGDYDFAKFASVVDTNFLGVVRMVDPVSRIMARQGSGQIALIASVAGYFGLPRSAAYGATKAAMIQLAEVMRIELASKGIDVRLIAPGFVKSELTAKNDFPMPFLLETEDAAKRIVHGLLDTKRFNIAFPKRMVALMRLAQALPYGVRIPLLQRSIRPKGK